MIKYIDIFCRQPGLSFDQFNQHWHKVHGPLAARLPGLRCYTQNPVVDIPGREYQYDGLAELWFDDLAAMEAAWRSEEAVPLRADGRTLLDRSRSLVLVAEERPVIDQPSPPSAIKYIGVFQRRPGLSVEEVDQYWRTTHAALARQLPGIRRYVQNRPLDVPGRERRCDGLAELWFEDVATLRAAWRSPQGLVVRADEPNLADLAQSFMLVVRERPIIP